MQEVPPREPSGEAPPPPKGRVFLQNTARPDGHHDGSNESSTKGRSRQMKTLPRVTVICATLLFYLCHVTLLVKHQHSTKAAQGP